MRITADYHMHSSYSGDSDAPMETMILSGMALGMERMCFTEHMDMDYVYSAQETEGCFDLDTRAYREGVQKCRDAYGDRIWIGFGVEMGLQPHLGEAMKQYVRSYDFDFVIGSSHLCNRKDPYYPEFFRGRDQQEAYREYFEATLENIRQFDDFDVYGHLDYVVRYGPEKDRSYTYAQYADVLDAILELLVSKGKGMEINTGAIPHGLRELNPCTDILKRYRELGGEIITVGSDAHGPGRIGQGFDLAADFLRACGYKYYTVFEKRQPQFMELCLK